jgi:hypothetical protein
MGTGGLEWTEFRQDSLAKGGLNGKKIEVQGNVEDGRGIIRGYSRASDRTKHEVRMVGQTNALFEDVFDLYARRPDKQ